MPNYAPHSKVVFGGRIFDATSAGNPIEIWTCGYQVVYDPDRPMTLADATAHANLVRPYFQDPTVFMSATVSLEYLKINRIGPDGKYVDPVTIDLPILPVVRGGNTTNLMPTEVALRVSWNDGTRSPRGRGGFYLPRPGLSVAADGRYSAATIQTLAEDTKGLLDGINAIPTCTMVVASSIDATLREVTQVKVGRVPDVIRRRRNALAEDYVELALVGS